jgi:hypothetical protein
MGVFQNNLMGAAAAAASAGGSDFYTHQIANSARFTSSGVLTRTAGTPTNIDKFTISFWVKKSEIGATQNFIFGDQSNINYQRLGFNSSDKLELHEQRGAGDSNGLRTVDQVFRDTSAWYNVVWVYDSGNATEEDREIFYVNGTRLTDVEGWDGGYPSQNRDSVFNQSGSTLKIGGASSYYGNYLNGYMAEVVFNDGQAYAASDYGETKNGVWIPKDPSGLTFGNNGFYLKFESSSDIGNDSSGNNNDFTESGVDTHDQMLDTPTFDSSSNGGNFCVMNPLNSGSNNTFSEGNLKVTNSSGGCSALGTMSLVTGHKWYFEGKVTGSGNNWIGIIEENGYTNSANTNSSIAGSSGFNNYLYGYNGSIYYGANSTATGATITTDDIIGVLVDLQSATNTIQFYKNGSAQGSAFNLTGTGINYTPMSDRGSSTGNGFWFNFGQEGTFGTGSGGGNSDVNGYGSFYYDDGAAAKAICTANLPIADAVDPAQTDDNFPQKLYDSKIWTGGGTSTAVSGLGFQPDFVWIKERENSSTYGAFNSTMGNTKLLGLGMTAAAEVDQSADPGLESFDSDGFTVDYPNTADFYVNRSGEPYIAWNWRANGGTTSTNSTGSVNVTQQVDPSGAFSISTYTGAGGTGNIGHGLSSAATFVIIKQTNGVNNYCVYAKGAQDSGALFAYMDSNSIFQSGSIFGNTEPSSTLVYLGDNNEVNHTSRDYIAWCWANVEGYCKSGHWIGNANANGSFIYTGFKPAFLMLRYIGSGESWVILDDERDGYNPTNKNVRANSSNAEASGSTYNIDFLSNGFKPRTTWEGLNGSGYRIVYLAMAHNPFKYATAR